MNSVYFNSQHDDDTRRGALYQGQLYVYSARPSTSALSDFAREMSEEAFGPLDPRTAQHHMKVEDYSKVLAELKPKFIHHPRSKQLIRNVLEDLQCDLAQTYFDVPRLRTATSDGYLTSGLGYAFKPHRDTWYSPPMCQLNWWLPVYEITADNAMAFHTHYWNRPIKNSSEEFNYQVWMQTGRQEAPKLTTKDTRRQSEALEPIELDPQLRLVCEPGGLLIFSAAHLHSTVPNTSGMTRLSIDFRTVHSEDLREGRGAPNIDSACSGTTIRDYLRGTDLIQLPEEICQSFETSPSYESQST